MESGNYREALTEAINMMMTSDLEPTSAIREAGHLHGINWGQEMGEFVNWAWGRIFGESHPSNQRRH